MRHLKAFLLVAGRPALFFWLAVGLAFVALLTLAAEDPDFFIRGADSAFLSAFAFSALAGLLAGLTLQELQHCSFVWPLPGVRWKTALGFAAVGLVFALVVVAFSSGAESPHGFWSLLAIALSGYCVGALAQEPLYAATTWVSVLVCWGVWFFSERIGSFCAAHPAALFVGSVTIAAFTLWHRFRAETFRRVPFLPISEMVGSFGLPHAEARQREKMRRRRPSVRKWLDRPLGDDLGRWLLAGLYESFGRFGVLHLLGRVGWAVFLFLALLSAHAMGVEGGWAAAFPRTAYQVIFMPPHLELLADPPYELVALWMSATGLALAGAAGMPFDPSRHYPVSRRDRAKLSFRLSLLIGGGHLLLVLAFFTLVGSIAGWIGGVELRADFLPLFVRVALVSLILGPIVHLLRYKSGSDGGEMALPRLMIVGIVYVVAVMIWSVHGDEFFASAGTEAAVLLALAVVSQAAYRRRLRRLNLVEDLV